MHRDAFHIVQSTAGVARWARDHSAVSLTDLNECVRVWGYILWACAVFVELRGFRRCFTPASDQIICSSPHDPSPNPNPYLLRLRIPQEVAILHSPWRHFPCVDVDTLQLGAESLTHRPYFHRLLAGRCILRDRAPERICTCLIWMGGRV
jgi:hypothetical protein